MFFKRDKDGLNGMDRAVQQAGVQLSRRRFLSSAAKWGAGLGLGLGIGLASTRPAAASSCREADTCVRRGTCANGQPKFQSRIVCDDGSTSWENTTCGWC
jgi:hypothetical protein